MCPRFELARPIKLERVRVEDRVNRNKKTNRVSDAWLGRSVCSTERGRAERARRAA